MHDLQAIQIYLSTPSSRLAIINKGGGDNMQLGGFPHTLLKSPYSI